MGLNNITEWLTFIQGKKVSQDLLEHVKNQIGDTSIFLASASKKQLLDKICSIVQAPNVDCKYIYENLLGFHIDPIDLQTENLIISEFESIKSLLGEAEMNKVPMIYILQKVSIKNNLNIKQTITYPIEKVKVYDSILSSYLMN